jgi:eukaryotic-like serine/threonine-protein kinase
MQPTLEALMTGASVLLNTAMALGVSAATLQRGPRWGKSRGTPAARRRRLGPYELHGKIAAGAMGEVYRAHHTATGELRAVKLLSRQAGKKQRLQFEKEIQFGQRLRHPNLVSADDHGEAADGTLYFSMDLLDGVDLEALVERDGALPPRRVIGIIEQIARVLVEVHDQGFVHRDIKPSNILICQGPDGQDNAKLLDFGLVKHRADRDPSSADDNVVGTPLYISPEAISAPDTVDGRTDIYGLGAVAYFLLTGAPPFRGRSVVEVCAQHLLTPPEPLRGTTNAVSAELERLVLGCLAKDPAARPASARALLRRLGSCPEVAGAAAPRARHVELHASASRECPGYYAI